MLFDLRSGKRQVVVKVVYATLAILMGGSLVLFGIGSDAPGGILDALGLGGGNGGSSNPQYEEQIDNAEEKLETDPNNQQALLQLVRFEALSAQEGITTDPQTLAVDISEDGRTDLEQTVKAWERYLDTDPKNPNPTAANSASLAYRYLQDFEGAAQAQEYVAGSQKTASAYALWAQYLYASFQYDEGDAAAAEAVALTDQGTREQARKQLAAFEESARKYEKQLEKQGGKGGGGEAAGQQLEDPFGTLGGSSELPAP
jgi:hypothetical protein